MILGTEKNPVKGGKRRRENGRSHVSAPKNAPMTSLENVIIGRIGITGTVIETGTRKGKGKEIVVVIVIVEGTEGGIVVATMSVIEIETVTGSGIALERGREIMKLGYQIMIVGARVIKSLIMTALNQNMRGTDVAKESEIMILLPQKMTRVGLNNLNMAIGTQTLTMILSTMSVIEASMMIIWMPSMTMIVTNCILIAIMIAMMIEWRKMITIMKKHQLRRVKGREVEMWSVIISVLRDQSLGSMNIDLLCFTGFTCSVDQVCSRCFLHGLFVFVISV